MKSKLEARWKHDRQSLLLLLYLLDLHLPCHVQLKLSSRCRCFFLLFVFTKTLIYTHQKLHGILQQQIIAGQCLRVPTLSEHTEKPEK